MEIQDLFHQYTLHPLVSKAVKWLKHGKEEHLLLQNLHGSARALAIAAMYRGCTQHQIVVLDDSEAASYVLNDLLTVLPPTEVVYFPSSYRKRLRNSQIDTANEILRTETLNRLANNPQPCIVVTYPEALMEKVVRAEDLQENTLLIKQNQQVSIEKIEESLLEFDFRRVDFVYEPGQFAVRGGIVDIFSFAYEMPYRVDFFGDEVDSIRIFDIETQLSKETCTEVEIVANLQTEGNVNSDCILSYLPQGYTAIYTDFGYVRGKINQLYNDALTRVNEASGEKKADLSDRFKTGDELAEIMQCTRTVEIAQKSYFAAHARIEFNTSYQQLFHKNFEVITQSFHQSINDGYSIYILSDSKKQTDRIASIFEDMGENIAFTPINQTLHEGFTDHDLSICCYTDHQIFERFHKVQLKTDKTRLGKVIITLKELNQFQIGDYIVHIDHGVGKFGGLVRTNVNGKTQEMVKLIYKDDDIIFVSIHSLHRISKYKGKDGEAPRVNKLGSGAWERLKERTKSKVKDIARDLILLYAKRKSEKGYKYAPDNYLQNELEATFLYEDTPDQMKATIDFKKDMESDMPMDRLVCGDVGFGKTEVAMRAAFKAVCDSKQVAVLVPTTVLALQHYKSFKERYKNLPCRVEYITRARTTKQVNEISKRLENGEIDVLIGTHKIVGKSVKFKDLGLLIIDEEQKFGVAIKDKLKQLKVNVDTLTLTATPIPRTLQFSLMGARDLSIMTTPPPNRYPVQTEIILPTDEDIIQEAIQTEINRNGQVFYVNNRIQNIYAVENMIKRLVPGVRVAVGHGQMNPGQLEDILTDFVNYEYDVLIATTIIESGIDIPNVNTIIINAAHRFGLSDLHQLRGRVGRSNRKAFCYLVAPDNSLLTPDARRRLQAIETFAELGSGFNIAMQDLDIRGAGNMLGAEQSGFIADLGYETYQKILDEAVLELKENEFSELYKDELEVSTKLNAFVNDCQIDSDLELGFPMEYIESISERISLYRELDGITTNSDLADFKKRLIDRFGAIPHQAEELMTAVQLRWTAMRLGIEKLVIKSDRLVLYLVSNPKSYYYQSEVFGRLLTYLVSNPKRCQLREQDNGKRSAVIAQVKSVSDAWQVISKIND